jgi:dihydroorotase
MEEKSKPYFEAPAGGPLVQHGLTAMLEFWHKGKISLEQIVQKMSHNPAILFRIEERGFIREGYWADLVLVDPNAPWLVAKDNILAKCGWSPFMGQRFHSSVTETFVSGNLVFENGNLRVEQPGARLTFKRI